MPQNRVLIDPKGRVLILVGQPLTADDAAELSRRVASWVDDPSALPLVVGDTTIEDVQRIADDVTMYGVRPRGRAT